MGGEGGKALDPLPFNNQLRDPLLSQTDSRIDLGLLYSRNILEKLI